MTNESVMRSKFSKTGEHLFSVSYKGVIERFDFDRCTGILSNTHTYSGLGTQYNQYWGFEVSLDESKIYTSLIYQTANQDSSFLLQFDLNATNFLASVDTLGVFVAPPSAGLLQRGPDDKIYLSVTWTGPDSCFDYLYCYGTVNVTNSNISVVNYPDSLGASCSFQPFSFNLGGHKAYFGLPNNPNYELGHLVGSPCDTLTVGVNELISTKSNLMIFYDPQLQTAFVNAKGLKGHKYVLQVISLAGQIVLEETGNLDSEYYTRDLVMSGYASGLYLLNFSTEKETLTSKFVKE